MSKKEFLSYNTVRNNALKIAHRIYNDGFVPDVIYTSLRGGAYMANVISEYFKIVRKDFHPVLYAAVVARSYSDIHCSDKVMIDGWTYAPDYLRHGDKIMLVDDIFDTGRTINALVEILLEKGIPRKDIKVIVHDYKHFTYREQQPIHRDGSVWRMVIVVYGLEFEEEPVLRVSRESRELRFFTREELREITIAVTHEDIVEELFVNG